MAEEESKPTEATPSLFPVFGYRPPSLAADPSSTASSSVEWLQNRSFTTDVAVINDAVAKYDHSLDGDEEEEGEEEEDKLEELNPQKRPPEYEIVPSSPSDASRSSSDREYRRKRKKKRKGRKREEFSFGSRSLHDYTATLSSSSRKPAVRKWASSSASSNSSDKEYYFDSRGDPDNVAFGCIYRMDVARYKLYNSGKFSESGYLRGSKKVGSLELDNDVDGLDTKLRSGGRYWSAKYSAVERHKNLKRMRILPPSKPLRTLSADYIPLVDEVSETRLASSASIVEESWEDEVLRKTKDFNRMTRERPHDESAWLAFAEFQDKVASMQPQKGARLQILEKKISILEKAIELNPDSEDLLLALMNAYRSKDSSDVLNKRWEKILTANSGSIKLWREFLRVVQSEFSRFKVSEMRKIYANAIRTLAGACIKQHRQAYPSGNSISVDPGYIQLELGLVDIFLSLCRLEWQAGYQELATALFQAEIEYSLFCPLIPSEQSKHRLFEHFWSSNGARIGEDGAVGWSTWLEKEEAQRQELMNEEASNTVDEGGWSGWYEPSSKDKDSEMQDIPEGDPIVEKFDDEAETDDTEPKDDVDSLLKALGIDANAEADIKVKDTKTWTKWSHAEMARDSEQWMPIRAKADQVSHEDTMADAEDDEQLLRIILYEDVSDYLFSLNSEEARMSLIAQFIDFYQGTISQWACTNSPSWVEKTLSLDTFPHSLLVDLRKVHDVLTAKLADPASSSLELLLDSTEYSNMRSNMMTFLRNAILLCLKVFPQNYILEEAVLVAEEMSSTKMNPASCSVTPCRALAKTLLKNNRQDVLLCGVYARREAFFGNIDHSRKVFDMALSSIDGLPQEARPVASLLHFWYAEVELDNNASANSESIFRATHILTCLGSGSRYSPFKGQPSSVQVLKARQGFKDRIKTLSSTWARGIIDDHSAALVCSASLFEELTSGWASALEILEHSFTMVLPERRRNNRQLEFLFHYYVRMLYKHRLELKISTVWDAIAKGLQMYPFNPNLHNVLVEISHLHATPNKLRWTFDDYCQKNPSVITWLYAVSFEISIGGSQHRIRGLFEKALENDKFRGSVILWRCYMEYERRIACDVSSAKRLFFRAIHACAWSKRLWLDGFLKLDSILTVKELSDLQEVMRDKELNLRTDIYEILLQDDDDEMDT